MLKRNIWLEVEGVLTTKLSEPNCLLESAKNCDQTKRKADKNTIKLLYQREMALMISASYPKLKQTLVFEV